MNCNYQKTDGVDGIMTEQFIKHDGLHPRYWILAVFKYEYVTQKKSKKYNQIFIFLD